MKRLITAFVASAAALMAAKADNTHFSPGARTELLAHNAYPDHGKFEDRLDRAISSGTPFVVEEDLSWVDGKSLLIHGKKNLGADDPTLDTYFFPKVAPVVEKALKDGNKRNWPLIVLYLDIKNDPPEHLAYINEVLAKHEAWLTTAKKTDDIKKQSKLDLKPMMVLVEDKQQDIKQKFFYDDVPTGGKIRVFGSVTKPDANPGHKLSKQEALDKMVDVNVTDITTSPADNYHRWWGTDWSYIEKGGPEHAGEWTPEKDQRLKQWIEHGHKLGYFMSVYCLDGYDSSDNQGWDKDYNFGSKEAVEKRWEAAAHSGADFISTDQYEDVSRVIRAKD